MDNVFHIKQDLGAPLNIKLVDVNQRHNQRFQPNCAASELLVEFYDASFAKEPGFEPYGQYIGGYCKNSLDKIADHDLIINSRVPQWFVEKDNLTKINNWLGLITK